MKPYVTMSTCRRCGGEDLVRQFRMDDVAMTGYFPLPGESVASGPLTVMLCADCMLMQLRESYQVELMYTDTYGYHSSLNGAMVRHLQGLAAEALQSCHLVPGDVVVDVGGNDGTLLEAFPSWLERWNVDPLADRFMPKETDIRCLPEFFDDNAVEAIGEGRVSVLTSVAMFYDLDDPVAFARSVRRLLRPGGAWFCQVQDTERMMRDGFYDTLCHEHIDYYLVRDLVDIARRAGMEVVSVRRNDSNGGSFRVEIRNHESPSHAVERVCIAEAKRVGSTFDDYVKTCQTYFARVVRHREIVRNFLNAAKAEGKTVAALGASTRGNVVLQWCGVTPDDIVGVGEINRDKFGRVTPGTGIGIKPEGDIIAAQPDYLMVLPWHFRAGFERLHGRLCTDDWKPQLVFPLPEFELWPA